MIETFFDIIKYQKNLPSVNNTDQTDPLIPGQTEPLIPD
jgi:hypothetical protein